MANEPDMADADRSDDEVAGEADVGVAEADATPLCLSCLKEVSPSATFCAHCGAPVGTFATLDPMNSIYATGWLYRKAAHGTASKIALVGMWLIFLPSLILVMLAVLTSVLYRGPGSERFSLLAGAAMGVVYVAILARVTRGHRRSMRAKRGQCERCGYDIMHLATPRCPECGTAFDPGALPREDNAA